MPKIFLALVVIFVKLLCKPFVLLISIFKATVCPRKYDPVAPIVPFGDHSTASLIVLLVSVFTGDGDQVGQSTS